MAPPLEALELSQARKERGASMGVPSMAITAARVVGPAYRSK